ncbi:hypothetical protein CU102_27620 [Phyllobacterium brassicacearum]|uniref:Uncharacterized protein n=1 Tax=Phyllobacterium brassicacearum TaxID=314235 RepID=A0A2P7B2V5_9HYPH|nr:hypothetical protein CU102_27620 [Phyllobacterium brassicacearum]
MPKRLRQIRKVSALLREQVTRREYKRTVQTAVTENVPEAIVELLKKLDQVEQRKKPRRFVPSKF